MYHKGFASKELQLKYGVATNMKTHTVRLQRARQALASDCMPFLKRSRRYGRLALTAFCLLIIGIGNITWYLPQHTSAVGTNMMVFWDPGFGSVPTGWTLVTTYDGKFPRGDTVANYGTTGGAGAPYTPTTSSVTVSGPSASVNGNGGTSPPSSSTTHIHPVPTVTIGADSNGSLPAYRSLQLIKYNSGIPTIIPGGAITLFDTNGSIPSGWTRISAQDGKMLRVNSTVATGGADTATNSVIISSLANSTDPGSTTAIRSGGVPFSVPAHAHSAPANGNTTAVSTLPPYVEPQLAQANANTATISVALVAMFDGDPGAGWNIVSGTGGAYNQQFIRPAATASLTSLGTITHTPPTYVATSGTVTTAQSGLAKGNGGGNGTPQTHTHDITVNFNSVSNFPPYFNVVIAQKVSFTLQNYRWFIDVNSENTTDAWPTGAVNIAQNTVIPVVPPAYMPPDTGTQLRLRIQMLVSAQALPASSLTFKLQFKQGSDGVCTTGSWTDVGVAGGGAVWTYGTNILTDGTQLTASQISPTSSILERFSKTAASGTNTNAVSTGQTAEYDYLIKDNTGLPASQYSFRMVESTGTLLSLYSQCPSLVTLPGISQEMRHGEFFQDGVDQGFAWAN